MTRLLPLLSALALLTGCPSFTTMGTARTMPKGKAQVYFATGVTMLRDFQLDSAASEPDSFSLPSFEAGARYAVTDRIEVGGKLFPLGTELNAKFGLVRSPSPDEGVSVALAPAVSVYSFEAGESATYLWLHAPLLVGLALPGGSELTLGPRASGMLVRSGGDRLDALFLGGSLGLAWKVADGFRILPEVSASYPVAASVGGAGVVDFEPRGVVVQANVGFLLGGD